MRGIDTSRIVARMANQHAVWNGAEMKFVGNAMRGIALSLEADRPISLADRTVICEIRPTVVRAASVCMLPKACLQRGLASGLKSVAQNVAFGFASNPSVSAARYRRNGRKLTASTVAVSVRDFIRGIIEGHRKLAFLVSCLGTFRDVAGAISIGVLLLHFTIFERVEQGVYEGR